MQVCKKGNLKPTWLDTADRLACKFVCRVLALLGVCCLVVACRSDPHPATAVNQLKLQVTQTGFYRVTLAELQEAGLAVETLQLDQMALSQAETAVPYLIHNDGLIFYGQASDSRYTAVRPYILRLGEGGVAMAETAVPPVSAIEPTEASFSLHLEENLLYEPQALTNDADDLWFWQTIGQSQQVPLTISLPELSDGSGSLRLGLWGFTYNPQVENDHDFDVWINGQQLDTVQWDGNTYHTAEITIPPGTLQAGENSLILDNEVAGASFLDIMRLNWVEVVYRAPLTAVNDRLELQINATLSISGFSGSPLLFDVISPGQPALLINWVEQPNRVTLTPQQETHLIAVGPDGFFAPVIESLRQTTWKEPTNQADLLIITTGELAPALEPLVKARQEQGLTVALVSVEDIYDEFGYGAVSPESIQAFLQYTHEQWQSPQPRYVLLVGDATSDYHNNLGKAPRNAIPPFLVPVAFGGETVSDSRLADVDGDVWPDMAIGRWPVDTPQELSALVERTLAYEQGNLVNHVLFAADGTEPQFASMATQISDASHLPADSVTLLIGPQTGELAEQWNQGGWLTTYVGHGSLEMWGKEALLTVDSVPELTAVTPPIMLQLTCLTGLFAHPEHISLSEVMLHQEQGPVLIIAATSLTLSTDQQPFATRFIQLLQDSAVSRIGDAFLQAKRSLDVTQPGLREISDTYVLLGDPSAVIIRP